MKNLRNTFILILIAVETTSTNINMNIIYIVFVFIFPNFLKGDNNNNICEFYQENYDKITRECDSLFSDSFTLYNDCSEELDNYINLYERESEHNDRCIEKLKQYKEKITNLNDTESLIRENVLLEAELLNSNKTFTETLQRFKEKLHAAYNVISECKQNFTLLKNTNDLLLIDFHQIKMDKENFEQKIEIDNKNCNQKIEKIRNEVVEKQKTCNKVFDDISDCVEREDNCLKSKRSCTNNLNSCRRTKKKLKDQQKQLLEQPFLYNTSRNTQ